jgi:hypothetical protein
MNSELNKNNLIKIDKNYLKSFSNKSILNFFGKWVKDISSLHLFTFQTPIFI